jgi:hypothetical protein
LRYEVRGFAGEYVSSASAAGFQGEAQSFCCSRQRDDRRAIEALSSNERTFSAARYPLSNGLATSWDVVPAKAGTHRAARGFWNIGFRLRGNDRASAAIAVDLPVG